jgi:glutamate-5-semialdehyde dehydrogenase
VLRGGSEAFRTNCLIADVLRDAATTIPREAIALVRSTDRAAVKVLLKQDDFIDVIIPRGGEELIRRSRRLAHSGHPAPERRLPALRRQQGRPGARREAHDERQDAAARRLQRHRNLLVHRDVAAKFLPAMATKLVAAGVELRGCPETVRLVPGTKAATEADWGPSFSISCSP